MANKVETIANELARPLLDELGFELVDVQFVKEGANWYLRFFIDKEGGITINNCEAASRSIEKVLDEKDPIKDPYILEVSSPGIERPLKQDKDFIRFKGSIVEISLYKAINKKKSYIGELISKENDIITIRCDDELLNFNNSDVSLVKLHMKF